MGKIIFILFILILFQNNGYPQNNWQIKAGPDFSYFVNAENSSSKIGYILGIARKMDVYADLDIIVELDYTTKGAILNDRKIRPVASSDPFNAYSWDIIGNIAYVEMTVMLSYSFSVFKEYNIGLFLGPVYTMAVKDLSEFRKVEFIEEYDPLNPSTTDYDYHFEQESGFVRYNISTIYNFGLNISYSNFFFEFRYVLNNKGNYSFGTLRDVHYEINTYQFLLGMSI